MLRFKTITSSYNYITSIYLNKKEIGYINYCFNNGKTRNNKTVYIINLMIIEKFRNNGYAKLLLLNTLEDSYNKNNMCYVELDDDSDNFRKNNNIYTELGLKYVNNYGPEMKGYIKKILQQNNRMVTQLLCY